MKRKPSTPLPGRMELPPLPTGSLQRADGRPDFNYLRRLYHAAMPVLIASDRWVDPHWLSPEWHTILSPIESQMWSLVRSQPVPFYPQFPVAGYFLDFANPRLKVAIECDSRSWHERRHDLDEMRAKDLADLGWLVFGFSGRACMRLAKLPPIAAMAEEWRSRHERQPLPGTAFNAIPRGDNVDDLEIDYASTSTFEWFGPSLIDYVLAEERAEEGEWRDEEDVD